VKGAERVHQVNGLPGVGLAPVGSDFLEHLKRERDDDLYFLVRVHLPECTVGWGKAGKLVSVHGPKIT
jgi:hypothetical protein